MIKADLYGVVCGNEEASGKTMCIMCNAASFRPCRVLVVIIAKPAPCHFNAGKFWISNCSDYLAVKIATIKISALINWNFYLVTSERAVQIVFGPWAKGIIKHKMAVMEHVYVNIFAYVLCINEVTQSVYASIIVKFSEVNIFKVTCVNYALRYVKFIYVNITEVKPENVAHSKIYFRTFSVLDVIVINSEAKCGNCFDNIFFGSRYSRAFIELLSNVVRYRRLIPNKRAKKLNASIIIRFRISLYYLNESVNASFAQRLVFLFAHQFGSTLEAFFKLAIQCHLQLPVVDDGAPCQQRQADTSKYYPTQIAQNGCARCGGNGPAICRGRPIGEREPVRRREVANECQYGQKATTKDRQDPAIGAFRRHGHQTNNPNRLINRNHISRELHASASAASVSAAMRCAA